MSAPLVVEVTRGDLVESVHLVDAVVVDRAGQIQRSWGSPERSVMPRSALKPIQAVAVVATGAAEVYGLSQIELALCCASHNGEPEHVEAVSGWLQRIGLSTEDLECGRQAPLHRGSADTLVAAGVAADARHHNCSGKHAGFLSLCQHLGIEHRGYVKPDHHCQADHVSPTIEQFCEVSLSASQPGIDGCGAPVWSMPLKSLAFGWAKLAHDAHGRSLLEAMVSQPHFVAGTDRVSTKIMSNAIKPVAAKEGAEGVFCALSIEEGLALALKVRDGASRAAGSAVIAVSEWLGFGSFEPTPVLNAADVQVGEIKVVL